MTIALLATGDEIIHGDTLNTNCHEIAQTLCSEGLPLGLHMACSDKEHEIVDCLQFLADRHDIIIVVGGLGPTTDDLTRFALAKFTGDNLVEHEEALTHLHQRMKASRVAMNQGNLQQCLFPPGAKILANPHGSATGCCYAWNNKLLILLPGPPRECLPMFHHYVLPLLQDRQRSKKEILKWRIFGVAESEIGQVLEDALVDVNCQTGYRLETPYIEFKVRCAPHVSQQVKDIIDPILAPHIIAPENKKASVHLRELLVTMNEPITIIDEVTGGLLESLLVTPETHHFLNFNGLEKTKLSFHLMGLEEYWSQQEASGTTQVVIHYSNQSKEGGERQEIPWRSPLVVHYAAEWLCFRLFHLINQLH